MASTATIGALRVPTVSSSSSASSNSSNPTRKAAVRSLSFSSSCLSGDNVLLRAVSGRRGTANGDRRPMIVSPKAVSDSKNSQTCLDPDASRVSFSIPNGF